MFSEIPEDCAIRHVDMLAFHTSMKKKKKEYIKQNNGRGKLIRSY